MWKPGYHAAVTLTLSNDNGAQPQFEVKSVLSETWANRVCVREGAVHRVIAIGLCFSYPCIWGCSEGGGWDSAVPSCGVPLHEVMETEFRMMCLQAKEYLGCLLMLDTGRSRERSSQELSEGAALLIAWFEVSSLWIWGHLFLLFLNGQFVTLLC